LVPPPQMNSRVNLIPLRQIERCQVSYCTTMPVLPSFSVVYPYIVYQFSDGRLFPPLGLGFRFFLFDKPCQSQSSIRIQIRHDLFRLFSPLFSSFDTRPHSGVPFFLSFASFGLNEFNSPRSPFGPEYRNPCIQALGLKLPALKSFFPPL